MPRTIRTSLALLEASFVTSNLLRFCSCSDRTMHWTGIGLTILGGSRLRTLQLSRTFLTRCTQAQVRYAQAARKARGYRRTAVDRSPIALHSQSCTAEIEKKGKNWTSGELARCKNKVQITLSLGAVGRYVPGCSSTHSIHASLGSLSRLFQRLLLCTIASFSQFLFSFPPFPLDAHTIALVRSACRHFISFSAPCGIGKRLQIIRLLHRAVDSPPTPAATVLAARELGSRGTRAPASTPTHFSILFINKTTSVRASQSTSSPQIFDLMSLLHYWTSLREPCVDKPPADRRRRA